MMPPPGGGPVSNCEPSLGLAALVEIVRTRWPRLPIELEAFEAYAEQREVGLRSLSAETGADFYLAFACAQQLPGAIESFHHSYSAKIGAVGTRFGESQSFGDELVQRVFEKLFVRRAEQGAGISQYRAEAPLSAWVHTISRRMAFRQVKSVRPERLLDEALLAQEVSDACDQELQFLREQHREVVREALSCALQRMPAREKHFLKMNLVAGVTMDRIGKIYGISQSSVSRKIQRAIHNVILEAKAEACEKLRISAGEAESIFRLIQSCIDLTLSNFDEASLLLNARSSHALPQTEK